MLRVAMPAYTFYETDNRVIRYAETLARAGHEVDVFSLRKSNHEKASCLNGVNVYRIQKRSTSEVSPYSYLAKLILFFIRSSAKISARHLQRKYDLVHVHSVPDFEVFAAWLPKLCGAKLILDIHDLVPEFYQSKFSKSGSSLAVKSLLLIEKLSAKFADHVIVANDLWRARVVRRSATEGLCSAFINYPDIAKFFPRPRNRKDKFVFLYPGSLHHHQGLDIAIRAFGQVSDRIPQAEFHIYGNGRERQNLTEVTRSLGLEKTVQIRDSIPIEKLTKIMSEADVGVVPKRADGFGNEAFSTKIFEFMASGTPVICSSTDVDKHYFTNELVRFFESGNETCLAQAMIDLYKDQNLRDTLSRNALEFAKKNSWETKQEEYLKVVGQVTS